MEIDIFKLALLCFFAVLALLLSAVPGYFFVKKRVFGEKSIKDFSKILIYVTQPCLAVYTFSVTDFSLDKLASLGIFALMCVAVNVIMLGAAYLLFRKRYDNPLYRVMTVATTFGNCAFFGIPILEVLFPDIASGLIIYTTVYALVMNVLGWTVGSAIISGDKRFVSLKQILTNPALIGFTAGILIYIFRIPLTFTLPGNMRFTLLLDIITIGGRMATPLSMLIMGMRLGTMRLGDVFKNPRTYIAVGIKQIVMPLVAFLIAVFLPIPSEYKMTFFIICACPVASIVLNYAEMCGAGQKEGASLVLLGTIMSVVTLPLMSLMLGLL